MTRTEPMSKEEMKARLKAAFEANPRSRPRPATTKAQLAEQRLANAEKRTEAIAQDVVLSNDALAERLRDERGVEFSDQEIAHRQYVLDCAYAATRRVQEGIVQLPYHRRSATVGPRDSDAHLHQSPEDALWGKM